MSEPTKYIPRGMSARKFQQHRDLANAVQKACDERDTKIHGLEFELRKASDEVEFLRGRIIVLDDTVANLMTTIRSLEDHLRDVFRAAARMAGGNHDANG